MLRCDKCNGSVLTFYGVLECVNCGRSFEPEPMKQPPIVPLIEAYLIEKEKRLP